MILYQGKGYLVYIVPIVIFLLSTALPDMEYFKYVFLLIAISELVVAYISYREHKNNPYKYLDRETGEIVFMEHKNTIFWIKAEYWAVLVAMLFFFGFVLSITDKQY